MEYKGIASLPNNFNDLENNDFQTYSTSNYVVTIGPGCTILKTYR